MKDTTVAYIYLHSLLKNATKIVAVEPTSRIQTLYEEFNRNLTSKQKTMIEKIVNEANLFTNGSDLKAVGQPVCRTFLSAIQEHIGKEASAWKNNDYTMPFQSLTIGKECFPVKTNTGKIPDPSKISNDFNHDLVQCTPDTLRGAAENLLNILFKYTQFIPSPHIQLSDISLYDYCKISAALAVCLYEYYNTEGPADDEPFLLIGGDLSGIQPYIYQIVSKYAGKNLKGRSFYLRILSDAVVRFLLQRLRLFQCNLLYNSGGSFYLIAPHTFQVKVTLQEAISIIEKQLFKNHQTTLFAAIDAVILRKKALLHTEGQSLHDVWGKLFLKRDSKKNTKFAPLLTENYSDFFTPQFQGGTTARDAITGEEILSVERTYNIDGIGKLKEITYKQIELGKCLRNVQLMAVCTCPIPEWEKEVWIEPAGLGLYYYFLRENALSESNHLSKLSDNLTLITLNGQDNACHFVSEHASNNIYALEFYSGNQFNNQTFDELCEKNSPDAFERLGVLRMDVDNLGSLFQKGIPKEQAVLARYATFSRSLDYYFLGYLNVIQQEIAADNSFIIYSGGDDVFIVGDWETTINLAERIRNDFRNYTCNNPAFSISGGIAIIPPKYPIMKGAAESAAEEDNAKSHQCQAEEKNSLSFMHTALNWDKEYPPVKALKNKIVELSQYEQLPKSFISKIVSHWINAKIENHNITEMRTYWMLTYDLSRMVERQGTSAQLLIENCKSEICSNNKSRLNGEPIQTCYHPLELWALAARWAELTIRTNKKITTIKKT